MNQPPRPVSYILDHHALRDYATGHSLIVPALLGSAIERDWALAVSAVDLAEAYRRLPADQADTLDLLTGAEFAALVHVAALDKATARTLGRDTGPAMAAYGLGLLHLAALAREHVATVITGAPEPVRELLGPHWPVVAV